MNVAIVQAHLEWENVPVNLKLFNKRIAAIEGAKRLLIYLDVSYYILL